MITRTIMENMFTPLLNTRTHEDIYISSKLLLLASITITRENGICTIGDIEHGLKNYHLTNDYNNYNGLTVISLIRQHMWFLFIERGRLEFMPVMVTDPNSYQFVYSGNVLNYVDELSEHCMENLKHQENIGLLQDYYKKP